MGTFTSDDYSEKTQNFEPSAPNQQQQRHLGRRGRQLFDQMTGQGSGPETPSRSTQAFDQFRPIKKVRAQKGKHRRED